MIPCRPSIVAVAWSALGSVCLGACAAEPPCPPAELGPLERDPAFAVVLSDYASTAIALLDAEGAPITEAWLDSGTRASAISAGIGGDAVLPHDAIPGVLAIVERFDADLLTLVRFEDAAVRQVDLRGDDPIAPTGHSPNPQDLLRLDDRRVLVSRYNPALDARTPELGRGNDLIVVDLETGWIERRIDLGADAMIDGELTYARPAWLAMLEAGGTRRVLAALARLSLQFSTSGPGAIAVVDPGTLARTQILELAGVSGCGAIARAPGDASVAHVLCTGDAFANEDARRPRAAIVRVALDASGTLAIDATYRPPSGVAPPAGGLVVIDRARVIAVADPRGGDPTMPGQDVLHAIDVEAGTASALLTSSTPFVLGEGAYDSARGLLLVPDGETRVIHRFDVGATIALRDAIALPTCRALPPRQIARVTAR